MNAEMHNSFAQTYSAYKGSKCKPTNREDQTPANLSPCRGSVFLPIPNIVVVSLRPKLGENRFSRIASGVFSIDFVHQNLSGLKVLSLKCFV